MLRAVLLAVTLVWPGTAVLADARITVLMDLLRVSEVTAILRSEGLDYAGEIDAEMLNGHGGGFLNQHVGQIYSQSRMDEHIYASLSVGMTSAQADAAIEWFGSDTGSRIVALENAARRAMSDPAVEEAARAAWEQNIDTDDGNAALVVGYMEDLDLITRNVSGTMTSNYQFLLGLSDGGLFEQTEDQMLAEVYSQRDEIQADTESWLGAFLLMAYQPVSAEDLDAYMQFSVSDSGRALNAALFEGFDGMFSEISYALGRAVALSAAGNDI
ncbi:DUF2059 domain-containing protein [uncultured Roseobacter sp.]|uniref:DUF2059 domain-containing protein n=1 Tax=uncultured Roseobacter sp. TaxID=114847 RepID=UPI002609F4EA|nr:DUF2059 domain-containing protein [uncultured Roseobacter sp.]